MPIYEYQCQHCQQIHEFLEKSSSIPKTKCPNCDQEQLQRIISKTSFQLKGTGWYATDFKNNDKKKTETNKDTDHSNKKDCASGTETDNNNKKDRASGTETDNNNKKDRASGTETD